MPRLRLNLERASDPEGGSITAWCTDYWGEIARPGGGGRGSQRSQRSFPSRPECTKWHQNGNGGFSAWIDFKIAQNSVFT
jgi:hypothetical protein